ncbi:MAG TPA: TOMM precursor leader peptide-binding protein [Candidatus Dormibacteraeota bacterium]|nr:TOMM precursor leader peptide-binding protein [Candidatus Dormibacteraeota bacterium]
MFIRTPSCESYVGGPRAFGLVRWLEPRLDGERSLDEITRDLPPEGVRTVSDLVAHLVRIGAVDDLEAETAPEAPAPAPLECAPRALPTRGSGRLLAALRALTLGSPDTAPGPVLWVFDRPDRDRDRRLRRRLAGADAPWLPVRADLDEIWIGPLSGTRPGCATCLDLRRRAAHRYGLARERIARTLADAPAVAPVSARAVIEVALAWDPRDTHTAVSITIPEGKVESVSVLPVPGCPACGRLDDRRVTAAQLRSDPSRAAGLRAVGDRVERLAVGRRAGVIRSVVSAPDEALAGLRLGRAWVSTHDHLRGRTTSGEWAAGAAETAEEARAVAMLEALERYAATRPRGRRLEQASGARLGDRAIDPRRLILHGDDQYGRRGFRWAPYDPEAVRRWAWAYSVGGDRQVAVPADLVFHQLSRASADGGPGVRPLAYTTSNGSAIGSSVAEAAFHGLLEVLERDAFLVAWYRGRPLTRLRLETAEDPRIGRLCGTLRAEGYEIIALDVSLPELRIPSVWATVVNTAGSGLKTLSGACAHPDPEQAVLGALREAAGHLPLMRRLYERDRGRAEAMLADPTTVRTPADHALVFGCAEAFDEIEPLVGPRSAQPLRAHFGRGAEPGLDALCSRLTSRGQDVLFVDLTPADVAALGLRVVRALVPGALPITFGHGRERLEGTDRVPAGSARRWLHPLA